MFFFVEMISIKKEIETFQSKDDCEMNQVVIDELGREICVLDKNYKHLPTIVYVKPSMIGKIAGDGIFTKVNISNGFSFGRYCQGRCTQKVPKIAQNCVAYYGLTFVNERDEKVYIDGLDAYGKVFHWTAKINHSFHANVQIEPNGELLAMRNIACDEELFINYGLSYWKNALPALKHFSLQQIHLLFQFCPEELTVIEKIFEYERQKLHRKFNDWVLSQKVYATIHETKYVKEDLLNFLLDEELFATFQDVLPKLQLLTKNDMTLFGYVFDKISGKEMAKVWKKHEKNRNLDISNRKAKKLKHEYCKQEDDSLSKTKPINQKKRKREPCACTMNVNGKKNFVTSERDLFKCFLQTSKLLGENGKKKIPSLCRQKKYIEIVLDVISHGFEIDIDDKNDQDIITMNNNMNELGHIDVSEKRKCALRHYKDFLRQLKNSLQKFMS